MGILKKDKTCATISFMGKGNTIVSVVVCENMAAAQEYANSDFMINTLKGTSLYLKIDNKAMYSYDKGTPVSTPTPREA